MDTLTVRPRNVGTGHSNPNVNTPGQLTWFEGAGEPSNNSAVTETSNQANNTPNTENTHNNTEESTNGEAPLKPVDNTGQQEEVPTTSGQMDQTLSEFTSPGAETDERYVQQSIFARFNREEVMKAINDSGLLSYDVRTTKITNYLDSLYALARLLRDSGKYPEASDDVLEEIIKRIREYNEQLRRTGRYADLAASVMEFQMKSQVFDVFGESVDNNIVHQFMSTTDIDIDRQFRRAEQKLGSEGVANRYGRYYYNEDNPNEFKIDVILYANDDECISRLMSYAEKAFHKLNDDYRRKLAGAEERFTKAYDTIVSNGDVISKHNFRLPETISLPHDDSGMVYDDHLFADDDGKAQIKLNSWEQGVLIEEQGQVDYICWLRNPPRKPWSLCIPYEMDGEKKPAYPDFVVIRRDEDQEYIIDILEPHDPSRKDNLGKAKGFAEYARQNPGVGRIQLIREGKDAAGNKKFKRLDMSKSEVREKVSRAMTNDELDHIFDSDGFFMDE